MADGSRILIVTARYYEDIVRELEAGATAVLDQAGVQRDIIEAPGAFEIPGLIAAAAATGDYQGFIALGCVIRGETTHYDYVCGECARGLMELSVRGPDGAEGEGLAIGFGVLTVENQDQAWARANRPGKDHAGKDKGGEAARACLAVLDARFRLEEGL